MAQDSVGTGTEHRDHPTAPVTVPHMTDGIDPTRNATQKAPFDAVADSPSSHPKPHELRATDHSVLSLCKVPSETIQRARRTLCMPDMHNVRLDSHSVDPGWSRRADGAQKFAFPQRNEAPARRYRLWL